METLFGLSGLLILPFWALMIFLPRWRWTERVVGSTLICAAPAVVYTALAIPRLAEIWPVVARPDLQSVAALLGSPAGATIGWLHFLAFDLFVGRWIYLDARRRNVSAWLSAPVLLLTLMLGPCGFLLYHVVRLAAGLVRSPEGDAVSTVAK